MQQTKRTILTDLSRRKECGKGASIRRAISRIRPKIKIIKITKVERCRRGKPRVSSHGDDPDCFLGASKIRNFSHKPITSKSYSAQLLKNVDGRWYGTKQQIIFDINLSKICELCN